MLLKLLYNIPIKWGGGGNIDKRIVLYRGDEDH